MLKGKSRVAAASFEQASSKSLTCESEREEKKMSLLLLSDARLNKRRKSCLWGNHTGRKWVYRIRLGFFSEIADVVMVYAV